MKARRMLTVAMTGFALVFGGCAPSLAGKIVTSDGLAVEGNSAKVNVTGLDGVTAVILDVAPDGSFKTNDDLPDGEYLIEALIPGYSLESKRINLATESDVTLNVKRTASLAPGAIGAGLDGDASRGTGGATLTPPQM